MIQFEVLVGITEERAINLFLDQGKDRGRMTLQDSYGAAIEAGRPEYIRLKKFVIRITLLSRVIRNQLRIQ